MTETGDTRRVEGDIPESERSAEIKALKEALYIYDIILRKFN